MKKVPLFNLNEKEKENALNEIRILASINHPCVISYKEAFIDEPTQTLCIVMEYANDGDLFQKISKLKTTGQYLSERDIWKIFIQILQGLHALHSMKIMHRDIKSANVFIYQDFTAKLGDLNVSKILKNTLSYTQTGTPYYASPEVWNDLPFGYKSDIWSLGCVIYETICLSPPFKAKDMKGLYKKVIKGKFKPLPEYYSSELRAIIKSMLQIEVSKRPTCEDLLNCRIIQKVIEKYSLTDYKKQNNILLKTIEFPKNLMNLTERLPESKYSNDNSESQNHIAESTSRMYVLPKLKMNSNMAPIFKTNRKRGKHSNVSKDYSYSTALPNLADNSESNNIVNELSDNFDESLIDVGKKLITDTINSSSSIHQGLNNKSALLVKSVNEAYKNNSNKIKRIKSESRNNCFDSTDNGVSTQISKNGNISSGSSKATPTKQRLKQLEKQDENINIKSNDNSKLKSDTPPVVKVSQKSKSPSPVRLSKKLRNNSNFSKCQISFDKLTRNLKMKNKSNNCSVKIQINNSYHINPEVIRIKKSELDKNDISNIKGSPFDDNSNKSYMMDPPERDPSVLKSLDYIETPIIIEEDESIDAISQLKKKIHPYSNMYSGNISRNSIRLTNRKKSHGVLSVRSPFPAVTNMIKNNSKEVINYDDMNDFRVNSRRNLLIRDIKKIPDSDVIFNSQNYVENFIMKSKQIKKDRLALMNKSEDKVIKFSQVFKDLKRNILPNKLLFNNIIHKSKDQNLKRSQNYSVDYSKQNDENHHSKFKISKNFI